MNRPRGQTQRERAWKAIRIKGQYTLTEIATLAEAETENIRHYNQCLVAAGYVRQVGTRRQEGRPGVDKVFRLVKNTGPRPPIQKELRFLYDQNTGEYWSEDPEVAAKAIAASLPPPKLHAKVRVKVKPGSRLDLAEKKRGRSRVG